MANAELIEISDKIYQMAMECPVSGNDSNGLMEFHSLVAPRGTGFWDSYQDKKVLDVCAGVSDFTAKLLQLGADAYALDYGYGDIQELLIRACDRSAGLFSKSVIKDRDRYIKGSAHNMPFLNNTFDAVTSYYGIFGVIDDDLDLAYQSINEGLRVLKPGGVLSIGPLKSGQITPVQAQSENEILERLLGRQDIEVYLKRPERRPFFASPQDISRMGKLTIIKPS